MARRKETCDICSMEITSYFMARHINTRHADQGHLVAWYKTRPTAYPCPEEACPAAYGRRRDLIAHMHRKHLEHVFVQPAPLAELPCLDAYDLCWVSAS